MKVEFAVNSQEWDDNNYPETREVSTNTSSLSLNKSNSNSSTQTNADYTFKTDS